MISKKNPLYIKSSEADKTINGFLHIHENRRDYVYKEYSKQLTDEKLYNKVRLIENHDIKYNLEREIEREIERERERERESERE